MHSGEVQVGCVKMTTVLLIAAVVGAVSLLPVFLVIGLCSFNVLVRVLKHWDVSRPPPKSVRESLFGQDLEVAEHVEEVSDGLVKTVDELEGRIQRLETAQLQATVKEPAQKPRLKRGK
jgi:hypothetical protein